MELQKRIYYDMLDIFNIVNNNQKITYGLQERKFVLNKILDDKRLRKMLLEFVEKIIVCIGNGNKLLFCGNGGSAADCQHIVAEFVVKLSKERSALPAISLTSNTSIITAISNDFSFDMIFSRQLEGIAKKGDIFIGISTSGKSQNIIEAFKLAKKKEVFSVAITGESSSELHALSDMNLIIPTKNTQLIQEVYIMFFHIICELLDDIYE